MVVPNAWEKILSGYDVPYAKAILDPTVAPAPEYIFRAFTFFPPSETRVVILGQDPYHTPRVADGLAFSTVSENKIPPSLQNIFKELRAEGFETKDDPNLTRWATQGVLLLNASLSVRAGEANSHADYGWHQCTDAVIKTISDTQEHVVFILWGAFARKKSVLIDASKHLVLESAHPSPLSAHNGFFGNGHFKKANEYLKLNGRKEIDWC
jgi:uracil-DNA glycosylase